MKPLMPAGINPRAGEAGMSVPHWPFCACADSLKEVSGAFVFMLVVMFLVLGPEHGD